MRILVVQKFNNNSVIFPILWQATISIVSNTTPSFSKINKTCSSSRSFVMLLGIPTISMHSRREYCSILCMFLSISITFSLIFLCVMRVNDCFSATHTLIFRTSFSFLSSSNLESIILCFSLNSLLSFMSSVYLLIILFCSFKANSINWSLVIFSSCFLVKMMLPDIFIRFLSRHSLLVEDMPVLNEWY